MGFIRRDYHDFTYPEMSKELSFVLAAPIRNSDGTLWGIVDFDAGNEVGVSLLKTDVSDAVMYQLAQHVSVICSLSNP